MTNEKKVRTVNDKEKGVDFMAELKMDPGSMTLDLGSRIQNPELLLLYITGREVGRIFTATEEESC